MQFLSKCHTYVNNYDFFRLRTAHDLLRQIAACFEYISVNYARRTRIQNVILQSQMIRQIQNEKMFEQLC